ncbi:hypothetical protein PIB30_108701, partial [Stylosanthes scabra]|nr:hypothetical protein [Stylosanthes scabra]
WDPFASDKTSDGKGGDPAVDFSNNFRRIDPTEICVGQQNSDGNIFASSILPSTGNPTENPTKRVHPSNFRLLSDGSPTVNPTWTRNEEVVHMEPPSDHPLFQYFSRLDDLNNYIFNFSER